MNNDQKKPNNDQNNKKNRKNLRGLLILLGWALVLTIAINFLSSYGEEAHKAATTHEIPYSEFVNLVKEDKVQEVESCLSNSIRSLL